MSSAQPELMAEALTPDAVLALLDVVVDRLDVVFEQLEPVLTQAVANVEGAQRNADT